MQNSVASSQNIERKPARSFQDLIVWQKAHQWVLNIYQFTRSFPSEEKFGLTSQLRRAAVSVPANIAEGFAKFGLADKRRFMNISQGSLEECRYYLVLANDLNYGESDSLLAESGQVGRLLQAFIKSIPKI